MSKRKAQAKSCNCETSLSPLYATVTARYESADSAHAFITMRGRVRLETQDGLRNLLQAETFDLSYSLIAQALQIDPRILYFIEKSDKELFLQLYPEFRGQL